jgi:hypothetical protein
MREHEAFLLQAKSDYTVYRMLLEQDREQVPACHPLHYLQMATEKLAKAILISSGVGEFDRYSHVAFSLMPSHLARADVARKLGWENFRLFRLFLRRAVIIFRAIDELNPSVGLQQPGGGSRDGPNTEYPWRSRNVKGGFVWMAPTQHSFALMDRLRSADGAQMLLLVDRLLERFEAIFY